MNAKIYNGNVQPNPKEFKIWVNDEGTIKTWNGTKWVEHAASSGGSGSGDGVKYYRCDDSSVMSVLGEWGVLAKRLYENDIKIATVYVLEASNYKTANLAVSIDWGMETAANGKVSTVRESFESLLGITVEEFLTQYNIIEITKEQFYNLEV